MIVRQVDGECWLFDQRDHSALCGRMAGSWGAPPFGPVPHPVQHAAEIHDGGWPEWDERPRLDRATGRPHPYSSMPDADYHAIWERGLARGWEAGDATGVLVSLHAMRFFGRKKRPEDRALHREQQMRQAEALRRLNAPAADVDELPEPWATWHAWMFFWDGLSLFMCEGWSSPWTYRLPTGAGAEVEVRVERPASSSVGGIVDLRPYPFREPIDLQVTARVIQDRGYTAQSELDAAVAAAERRRVQWFVRPAA